MDANLEENARRFLKLASRLRRLGSGNDLVDEGQVSPSHLALIEYVGGHGGCGIQEMAEALHLSTPTVSVSVRQLEEKAYLTRQPHPEDGRAVQLFLTEAGENVHTQSQAFHCRKFEKLLSGLNPEEREILVSLLEKALNAAEINT